MVFVLLLCLCACTRVNTPLQIVTQAKLLRSKLSSIQSQITYSDLFDATNTFSFKVYHKIDETVLEKYKSDSLSYKLVVNDGGLHLSLPDGRNADLPDTQENRMQLGLPVMLGVYPYPVLSVSDSLCHFDKMLGDTLFYSYNIPGVTMKIITGKEVINSIIMLQDNRVVQQIDYLEYQALGAGFSYPVHWQEKYFDESGKNAAGQDVKVKIDDYKVTPAQAG